MMVDKAPGPSYGGTMGAKDTRPTGSGGGWSSDTAGDSTSDLLGRARAGDPRALETLFGRYLGPLERWASGRLPSWARDMVDTGDIVQETVIRFIRQIERFEPEREGALRAYLRKAVRNRIREELRRTSRKPPPEPMGEPPPDEAASPLEEAIAGEALERYEAALETLREEERDLIIARIEIGLSYPEIARHLHKPSPDAARMAVSRALVRLAEAMGHER
jgi:RNA polymerase sigma-70 factor (ECF subfamily)